MALYCMTVNIFERFPYPVVQHRFFGQTNDEVTGYYESHIQSDNFLRGILQSGTYKKPDGSNVAARVEVRPIEQVQAY